MQVGEGICVPGPASTEEDVPLKHLEAQINEIHLDMSIKVSVANVTVKTPHWKRGVDVSAKNKESRRPAAYLFKARGGPQTFKVKLEIVRNDNVTGKAKLRGRLDGLTFEGEVGSVAVGEVEVEVEIVNLPDRLTWSRGNASWVLEVEDLGATLDLGRSRLEFFVLYDRPAVYFTSPGVWAEALRFCFKTLRVEDLETPASISSAVTRGCFLNHGLIYDHSGGGGSSYEAMHDFSEAFLLHDYIQRTEATVNCYDQAAAVQTLTGALGVYMLWIYHDPYGFIITTNLIGCGRCNNPFFLGVDDRKVLHIDDPSRTSFGNHAYCILVDKCVDACAGPHLGTENLAEYAVASIDAKTTLYAARGERPGTKPWDAQIMPGVLGVKW